MAFATAMPHIAVSTASVLVTVIRRSWSPNAKLTIHPVFCAATAVNAYVEHANAKGGLILMRY